MRLPAELGAALRPHPDYPFEIADELQACVVGRGAEERLEIETGALKVVGLGPTLSLNWAMRKR